MSHMTTTMLGARSEKACATNTSALLSQPPPHAHRHAPKLLCLLTSLLCVSSPLILKQISALLLCCTQFTKSQSRDTIERIETIFRTCTTSQGAQRRLPLCLISCVQRSMPTPCPHASVSYLHRVERSSKDSIVDQTRRRSW